MSSFERLLGVVGFIGGRWVRHTLPGCRWVYPGSLDSLVRVIRFVLRLVGGFTRSLPRISRVHPESLSSFAGALEVVGFIQ